MSCIAIRITRLALVGVACVPHVFAEWLARVVHVRWALAIGDWQFFHLRSAVTMSRALMIQDTVVGTPTTTTRMRIPASSVFHQTPVRTAHSHQPKEPPKEVGLHTPHMAPCAGCLFCACPLQFHKGCASVHIVDQVLKAHAKWHKPELGSFSLISADWRLLLYFPVSVRETQRGSSVGGRTP